MRNTPKPPRPPDTYLVTLRVVAPVTFRVQATNPGQAKRTALDIARDMAAEVTASASLSDEVEASIDGECDWSFGVPNRREIPSPRKVRVKR